MSLPSRPSTSFDLGPHPGQAFTPPSDVDVWRFGTPLSAAVEPTGRDLQESVLGVAGTR